VELHAAVECAYPVWDRRVVGAGIWDCCIFDGSDRSIPKRLKLLPEKTQWAEHDDVAIHNKQPWERHNPRQHSLVQSFLVPAEACREPLKSVVHAFDVWWQ